MPRSISIHWNAPNLLFCKTKQENQGHLSNLIQNGTNKCPPASTARHFGRLLPRLRPLRSRQRREIQNRPPVSTMDTSRGFPTTVSLCHLFIPQMNNNQKLGLRRGPVDHRFNLPYSLKLVLGFGGKYVFVFKYFF